MINWFRDLVDPGWRQRELVKAWLAVLPGRVAFDQKREYKLALKSIAKALAEGNRPHSEDKSALCRAFRVLVLLGQDGTLGEINEEVRKWVGLAQLVVYAFWERPGMPIRIQWRKADEDSRDDDMGFLIATH